MPAPALSEQLAEFLAKARRVNDLAAQQRAQQIWAKLDRRLSSKTSLRIGLAWSKASKAHRHGRGDRKAYATVSKRVLELQEIGAQVLRRVRLVEQRRASRGARQTILRLVGDQVRSGER